ncbi:MAG: hypothetical protein EOO51_09230 [Flavobacterium sp.]|nr:MAG: hypothetical protein EOO51_09230 [Flavobacterium sp.]
MENFLYIPFNSLNFNNILSTESISPQSFYEKRGYGFKRFEKNILNPFPNSILCYGEIPVYGDIKSDREEFIAYLAIPQKLFRKEYIRKSYNGIEIFQIDYTVYINHRECFFIAKTNNEILKLKAATNRSLEVKNAENYLQSVKSIEDYKFNFFSFSNEVLDNIYDLKSYNLDEITFDRKLNKIKGFTYGYFSGVLSEQPEQILKAKFFYQEFVNVYSLLINELSTSVIQGKRNSKKNDSESYFTRLKDIIEKISILLDVHGGGKIDKKVIDEFKIDVDALTTLKSATSHRYRKSIFQIIVDFIKEREIEYFSIEETLSYLLDKTVAFLRNPSSSAYNSLESDFNSIRKIVSDKFFEIENQNNNSKKATANPFTVSPSLDKIHVGKNFLERTDALLYEEIIDEFLSHPELSSSDEIGQLRLNILANVGKSIGNKQLLKNDSPEMQYLRRLYESLKSIGVGFKINETESQSLKSIAAFFNRYSDYEKLIDFMVKNNLSTNGLVTGIWGSAYGYANISKIVLAPIFRNQHLQFEAEQFINKLYSTETIDATMAKNFILTLEKNTSTTTYISKSNNKLVEEPKNDIEGSSFLDMIIENKKLKGSDEWIELIENCFNQVNKENLSGELFSSVDYKANFFKSILVARAKSVKGFGLAKIEEAVNEYTDYLKLNE